jgi:hypothetical protein
MGIFNKEPALIIGTAVTILVGAIATLSGNGFISDAAAGKATDLVNSIAQLLVLLAPLIATAVTRGQVYSPETVEVIVEDMAVEGAANDVVPFDPAADNA